MFTTNDRLENSLSDGDMDKDGFYFAELNGNRGLVPSNFVISFLDYKVINKDIWNKTENGFDLMTKA